MRNRIDAADQAIMARLSTESSPVLDRFLPTLSRSADFRVVHWHRRGAGGLQGRAGPPGGPARP
jgi:hypothetical protein